MKPTTYAEKLRLATEPPRCTDCKWMGRDCDDNTPICKRPGLGRKNVVTGGMLYPSCAEEREGFSLGPLTLFMTFGCAEKGKYFQLNER